MPEKIKLKNGQIVEKPDDISDSEFLALIDKAFPPMYQMGESAAEDDALGVSTAGIEIPTDYGRSQAVRSFAQVPTFGAGDEIESFFTGKPASDIRSEMERYNVESGGAGTAAEMLGGAYLPIGKTYQYGKAALGGLAYGTGKAEGDIGERLQEGAATAVTAPLFMLGANTLGNIVSKPVKAAIDAYDQKMTKQSFDTLQNKLYKDLEMAGTIFSPQDTNRLTKQVRNSLESDFDWNPKTHKVANRALNLIENRNLKKMSWSELDALRQRIWNEYNTAKAKNLINETNYIRGMIDELDEFVNSHPATTPGIEAARKIYKQNQKMSALDAAWNEAKDEDNTAVAFTNAVKKMLKSKDARFLDQREIDGMKEFLKQMKNKKFKKTIANLDPSSSGLMLAINQSAGIVNPKIALAQLGASKTAKLSSEQDALEGLENLRSIFSQGTPFAKIPYKGSPFAGPSIAAAEENKPKSDRLLDMIPLPFGP